MKSKIISIEAAEGFARRETDRTVAALASELNRPAILVPQSDLDLLRRAALGNTDQSRACRYLLFLLAGLPEPGGSTGQGLIELRILDRKLADTFLEVLYWWRGPTKSDQPLYDVLEEVERVINPETK